MKSAIQAKSVFLFACTALAVTAVGEDKVAVWKKGDVYENRALWYEPSNWDTGFVPGRYTTKEADGTVVTNGTEGWTARFEGFDGADGNWLCAYPDGTRIVSVSNVVFSGKNPTSELGQGLYQQLYLEAGGGIYVEESCQKVPKIGGKIGLVDDRRHNGTYIFRNDSLYGELYMVNGFISFMKSDGSWDNPVMQMEGKGTIRLGGSFYNNSNFRTHLRMAMDEGGLFVVTNRVYNFTSLIVPAGLRKQHVRIEPNSALSPTAQDDQRILWALSDLEISGPGTFEVSLANGYLDVSAGVRVDIKSQVRQINTKAQASFTVKGAGTLRITGENLVPQDLTLQSATFEAVDIGMAGKSGNLGLGSGVRIGNDGTLRYVGEGEATDRAVRLTGGSGRIEQCGTGLFEISGGVLAEKAGTTLVLHNGTEFPMVLSGTVAADHNPAIRKTGAGEVVLSGSNLSSAGLEAEAGALTVESAAALPKLTVAGGVVLNIAEGVESTVDLSFSSGSLDVRIGNNAKFKATGMSGIAPDWLTLNGEKAKFASDGSLSPMVGADVEIAARGGVIPDAPDSVVGIVRDGDSGPVTLSASSTRVIALTQEASVDAVVRFGEGEKLTVESVTVRTNAAPLVFGESSGAGSIDVSGETLTIDTEGTNSLAVIRTGFAADVSKTLRKLGDGRLVLPDDFAWGGNLQIGAGTVVCTNTTGVPPDVRLSGTGCFEVAGDVDKTFSSPQPDFAGTLVLGGGVNNIENSAAIGKNQSYSAEITSAVQVREGAEMVVTDPAGLSGHIIVAGGSGTDGEGAVKIMSVGTANDGKVYSGCSGMRLTSDTVVSGHEKLSYFGFVRGGTNRIEIDMNGHRLLKTGGGRFLLSKGEIVNPGILEFAGPSGIWMQRDFDLGPEGSPALVMRDGASFSAENIKPQWRPIVVESGRFTVNSGQKSRYDRSIETWKGPVFLKNASSLINFSISGANSSSRFSLEGEISGPGMMQLDNYSLGILEILNPDNSKWTGALNLDGRRGGSVLAACRASIPPPNLVTCSYSRIIAPMPGWKREEILDYANNANLENSGFISVDSSALEDGSTFDLAASDVMGDDFALAHDGGNTLHLNIAGELPKPVGIGSFSGTLKVSAAGTLRLSRLVATSDSTNGCGKILLDGVRDVRLEGARGSVGAGASMNSYAKNDFGEIEIRNSTVRPGTDYAYDPPIYVGSYGNGLLKIGEGSVVTARIDFAMAESNQGAVWQTGGEVCNFYSNMSTMAFGTSGAAYHELRGGRATYARGPRFASGGAMLFGIYGGEMFIGDPSIEDYPWLGAGGPFHMYVAGGTVNFYGRCYMPTQGTNHTASAVLTVAGEGSLAEFKDEAFYMGGGARTNGDGPAKAVLNLNGGTVAAEAIGRYPSFVDASVQRAYVNFNGGTYRLKGRTSFGVASGYPTVPSRITVFEGGATIDTAGYADAYSSAPFEAPDGDSVVSIPVPPELAAREFVSPPYIEIFDFDGKGDGATAYAELDTSTRRISRIVVTSPGWEYTAPKAVFKLGKTAICTNVCAIAPAVGGGLTKTGAGTYLLAATNTYSGATVIKEGTLKIKFAEALPSNTVVSLEGGTLDLNGCTVQVRRIAGNGEAIVNGSVLMDGLGYDVTSGVCVTYGCPVAFARGAKVTVSNAASLDKNRRYAIAHFKGGVENAPLSFEGLPDEIAGEWKLILSRGYLKLYRPRGSVAVFR